MAKRKYILTDEDRRKVWRDSLLSGIAAIVTCVVYLMVRHPKLLSLRNQHPSDMLVLVGGLAPCLAVAFLTTMWYSRVSIPMKREKRRREGLCAFCGYALEGLTACPECGKAISDDPNAAHDPTGDAELRVRKKR